MMGFLQAKNKHAYDTYEVAHSTDLPWYYDGKSINCNVLGPFQDEWTGNCVMSSSDLKYTSAIIRDDGTFWLRVDVAPCDKGRSGCGAPNITWEGTHLNGKMNLDEGRCGPDNDSTKYNYGKLIKWEGRYYPDRLELTVEWEERLLGAQHGNQDVNFQYRVNFDRREE